MKLNKIRSSQNRCETPTQNHNSAAIQYLAIRPVLYCWKP